MYENAVVSPGHGQYVSGASSKDGKYEEFKLAKQFLLDAVARLDGQVVINLVWDNSSKNRNDNVREIVRLHKKYDLGSGKTLHISKHFNSASVVASGAEMLFKLSKMENLAKDLSSRFSKVMGINNRGDKVRTDLYILNNLSHSILMESCFINNPNDMSLFYKYYNALLDTFCDFILKNVRNLNKNQVVNNRIPIKVEVVNKGLESKNEVESMIDGKGTILTVTGRKGIISLSKKAIRDGIFTSPHKDIDNYSDGELISLLGACFDRLYDDIKGSKK